MGVLYKTPLERILRGGRWGGGSNLKDHSWGDEYFVESHNVFSRFNNVLD